MGTTLKDKMASLPAKRREKIEARAAELIAEELSLRQLRKAHNKTQVEMASALNMTQDGVSRLEGRTDLLLSTMQRYVKGLGGTLELVAKFPDREPVQIKGFGWLTDEEPAKEKKLGRPRRKRVGARRISKPGASRERRARA